MAASALTRVLSRDGDSPSTATTKLSIPGFFGGICKPKSEGESL